MGFIDKTTITVTARLTRRGRDYMSAAMSGDLGDVENGNQQPYIITKFYKSIVNLTIISLTF